jgi:Family of unknown function (DUF6481)
MAKFQPPGIAERLRAAASAKELAQKSFRARADVNNPEALRKRAKRLEQSQARDRQLAGRKLAREAQDAAELAARNAKEATEKAEREEREAEERAAQASRKAALEQEKKAERDARYTARKVRKLERKKDPFGKSGRTQGGARPR